MLTPSGLESAASVLGRTFVRRPDSTWAMADQLIPEWKASASLVQPRRSRAARTREPIPPLLLMFPESTGEPPGDTTESVKRHTEQKMTEASVQSDVPGSVGKAAEALR